MRQHQRGAAGFVEQIAIARAKPQIERVRRRHGRQSPIEPFCRARPHQPMRKDQRRLGLAGSSQILDHDQRLPSNLGLISAQLCSGVALQHDTPGSASEIE